MSVFVVQGHIWEDVLYCVCVTAVIDNLIGSYIIKTNYKLAMFCITTKETIQKYSLALIYMKESSVVVLSYVLHCYLRNEGSGHKFHGKVP